MALHQAAEACEQLVGIDRLDQIVVGADEHARSTVEGLDPFARDEDDRKPLAVKVTELAADLVSADVRKANVEHHGGRPNPSRDLERVCPVTRLEHAIADALEHSGDKR